MQPMTSSKLSLVLALAVLAPVVIAQTAAGAPGREAVASGTRIQAVLQSRLDTRHAKVGDRVTGKTTAAVKQGGKVVVPKGSRLLGRVTEVTPAANSKSRASLGVLFDQAVTPKGQRIPLHAAITGLTAAGAMAQGGGFGAEGGNDMVGAPMAAGGGGGLLGGGVAGGVGGALGGGLNGAAGGGLNGAAGGAVGAVGPVMGDAAAGVGAMGGGTLAGAGGVATGGMLRASNGALFRIAPAAGQAAPAAGASGAGSAGFGSLLTSQGGNLRLDSGSRMQLEENGPGGAGAGASGRARAHARAGGGR
jgi:hypothetical protein